MMKQLTATKNKTRSEMTPIYMCTSLVNRLVLLDRSRINDVAIIWLVERTSRKVSLPVKKRFAHWPSEMEYAEFCLHQCFTLEEAKLFQEFIAQNTKWLVDVREIPISHPPVFPEPDWRFYALFQEKEYDLPFDVFGIFCEQDESIEASNFRRPSCESDKEPGSGLNNACFREIPYYGFDSTQEEIDIFRHENEQVGYKMML